MDNLQRKFNKAFNKRLKPYKQKAVPMIGMIGNLKTGVVVVPNTINYNYVTTIKGEVIEVLNRRVPANFQTVVLIGKDPDDLPQTMQVLARADVHQSKNNYGDGLGYHHTQHEWPHGDTTYIFGEAFLDRGYFPVAGEQKVKIYPGNYYISTGWLTVPIITIVDISASIPTGVDEARYIVISVDASGNFVVRNGTIRTGVSSTGWNELTDVDIPIPLAGDNPICAVKLFAGETECRKDGNNNDFKDLRWAGVSSGALVSNGIGLDPIDCTSQIVSGGETHFTFTPAASVALVLLNGTIQKPADVTLDGDGLGVTLAFGVELGDNLIIIRGALVSITTPSGDVFGPSGATNNHIAVFDLATGKVIKDGGHTIAEMSTIHSQVVFTLESVVTVGDKPIEISIPYCGTGATIEEILVTVKTAPTTSELRVTVNNNGINVLTGVTAYLEIPIGSYSISKTTGIAYPDLAKDDKLNIEVIQGDVAAANMSVHVRYTWSL